MMCWCEDRTDSDKAAQRELKEVGLQQDCIIEPVLPSNLSSSQSSSILSHSR